MFPYILAALIIVAIIIVISNIHFVQQSRSYVIERLGGFYTVWGVGPHFKVPFIDRIARRVSLKEQVLDYPPQPVITKDNVTMQIDTVVYFQITDPKLYAYGVEQPMAAMETLTATTLRNIIGPGTGPDPDQPRCDQHQDARHSGRSHRPLGHQGQPCGAEEHHPAQRDPERHGEADEGRA